MMNEIHLKRRLFFGRQGEKFGLAKLGGNCVRYGQNLFYEVKHEYRSDTGKKT